MPCALFQDPHIVNLPATAHKALALELLAAAHIPSTRTSDMCSRKAQFVLLYDTPTKDLRALHIQRVGRPQPITGVRKSYVETSAAMFRAECKQMRR